MIHIRPRAVFPSRLLALLLLIPALLLATGARAEVRAWLDRSAVGMGETVTLNVEGDSSAEPDFSVLEQDFRIASRSSNTQIQLVNGAMARTNLWAVALEPRREGVIQIPAIAVGADHTAPMQLTVRPMARGSAAGGDDLFLELEATDASPYVQQQVGLTVRLFYAVALLDGNLDEPAGEGVQVRRIGQDVNYTRSIGARTYNVVERRYVLTPQRSGHTEVGGVQFRGRLARGGAGGAFFNQGTPMAVGGDPVALEVRPAPAGAPSPWLPARALRYTDTASALPAQARVGDALELSVTVEAEGLSAEQLPELTLPPIEGAQVYPDQETRETRESNGGLVGVRSRKFAIVPQREGVLTLPERSFSWWNTPEDRAQRNGLPARSIQILAATLPQADAGAAAGEAPAASAATTAPEVWPDGRWFWQMATALMGLLWIATLLLWLLVARRAPRALSTPAPEAAESRAWRPELAHALARGDLAAVRRALMRISPDIRDLGTLAARLSDPAQREALAALERALYRGEADDGLIPRLRAAFARRPELSAPGTVAEPGRTALAPLYPPR